MNNTKRITWDSRVAFIFAAIGSAVGLGNVWRFPYIAYSNGGGAFLIPYVVALITAGIPLMILEFSIGAFMMSSAPKAFSKIKEKFEFIGWLALLIGFVVITYYAVVMGWAVSYLIYSIDLRWGDDANKFFFKNYLNLSEDVFKFGNINLSILFGLVISWLAISFCIIKGVRSVGKVVLVTVPLPYLILIIFIIRGLTLPGAMEGLKFYLTPNFNKLLDPKVWLAAYSQVFFSLSIGFGVMIAYASFLPKNSDITTNAIIISLSDTATSFFAGFAVFSTLGYLAVMQKKAVTDVVTSGPGLAFVTYPTIIKLLPVGAVIFGILFFLLLITLAIDSAFSLVEAVIAGVMDKWGIKRWITNAIVCGGGFLIGIFYVTDAGLYWLDIVDHFINNFGLISVGLLECIIIGYVFGTKKLREYINEVSEIKIGIWWDICIKVIAPIILLISLITVFIERIKTPYENYPQGALLLGGWMVIVAVIIISVILMKIRAQKNNNKNG